MLGIRPTERNHHLGRETMLAPVTWNEKGWPVVNGGHPIAISMSTAGLPAWNPSTREPVRDEFDGPQLAKRWVHLRTAATGLWSLAERPGVLRLKGSARTLEEVATPAFVGRAQEHSARAWPRSSRSRRARRASRRGSSCGRTRTTTICCASRGRAARRVELVTRVAGVTKVLSSQPLGPDPVTLEVEAFRDRYEFYVHTAAEKRRALGSAPTQPLSSEKAGGFTGVYIGLYASGPQPMPPADFAWFDYEPLDD
jgi:alpha-N-arabinofuranosidase